MLDPDAVHGRDSFVQFVQELIADRTRSEALERESPNKYRYADVEGWQNAMISRYLECAFGGSLAQADWGKFEQPTWRDLALSLYLGKIYE